ncbi:MAG: hypothetical protein JWN86_1757 [Planctomycetota bacterium]|nr:hypothetical protein [Planctomycetota bacterium]
MPISTDAKRCPKIKWSPYQLERVPGFLLSDHFVGRQSGIGVICGKTSGSLEVLDFDDASVWSPWCKAVVKKHGSILVRTPVVSTPSGGQHLYWRCKEIEGNLRLARKPIDDGKSKIRIETRGQGGYAVLPGSPLGTHKNGTPYRLISGNFKTIVEISPAVRASLLDIARSFDLMPPDAPRIDLRAAYGDVLPASAAGIGERPGDAFNASVSWDSILIPSGWTLHTDTGSVVYWRRPGKDDGGFSASTGYCGDKLHVFSSNADPLEAEKTYDKFAAYAWLQHAGDFRSAAAELGRQGFGSVEDRVSTIIERFQS